MADQLAVGLEIGGGAELMDSTLDAAIVNERSNQREADTRKQVEKLIAEERKKQGVVAASDSASDDTAADSGKAKDNDDEEETEAKEPENMFIDNNVLYNSLTGRSIWYYMCGWLWCGCLEPRYKITSTYVIGEEWKCLKCCQCYKITDSMAYENVTDLQRRQSCFYAIASCCPCFTDMGDIHLMGGDDSHEGGWKLKRIHQSKKVTNELIRVIQDSSAVFKKR